MTDKQPPPDWAFERACSWVGRKPHHVRSMAVDNPERRAISALCDMIERYEQPPPDRKLLCAREAWAQLYGGEPAELEFRHGYCDDRDTVVCAIRAIELYEEGFGK